MRMPDDVAEGFSRQITTEMASAAAYLQMSVFFADRNLTGMSRWMRAQAEEERSHALRFLDFLLDRGQRPALGETPAPATEFADPGAAFAAALEQEQRVTQAIHELHRLATESGDLASVPFLLEFVSEQTEEEAMVETILDRIRLADGDASALLILDQQLGARPASA